MIIVNDVGLRFGDKKLFEEVNLKFLPGNCYGVIGANGAGKSTFLKVLSGEIEPNTGNVTIEKNTRMSVLKQNHYEYDEFTVMDAVIMGNKRLYDIMKEKDAIYAKEDFSDEDGIRASELEGEFAELDGWEAESDASIILQGLGLSTDVHYKALKDLTGGEKVKTLLAQALFGKPGLLILDEPTNHLDVLAINWLEEFLINFEGTVIVVSHDRHFLNKVCTHIADVDFGKINVSIGNYDFWYESSQLASRLLKDQNKKKEEKVKQLQDFIARFSANASKSKQATSRKKMLEKISIDDIPISSRKYPFIGFKANRELGKDVLSVKDLNKNINDEISLKDISFTLGREDKVAFVGSELAITNLFKILAGEAEAGSGDVKWGVTSEVSNLPKDNSSFFDGNDLSIVNWLAQYSSDTNETYLRGFLGRMLFAGEESQKKVSVLSGGEKVRCMFSKMMLSGSNVLILDQPTNHLDLESITAANNGIMDFKGVVLFASHDHQFLQTIANRVIEITEDGMKDYKCTYDEYLEKKQEDN